jgi:hypothetical protein
MRIFMQTISMLAIIAYAWFLWILSKIAYNPISRKDLIMFLPLVYFIICFCTSFARYRSCWLLIIGIVANSALVVWTVKMYLTGSGGWACAIPMEPWPFLWGLMYFRLNRYSSEKVVSQDKQ